MKSNRIAKGGAGQRGSCQLQARAVNWYKKFMKSVLEEGTIKEQEKFFEWTELYQAIADKLLLEYENDKDARTFRK